MATSNSRDVKMTLSVETLGAEDIKKLQASVAALAHEGGAAAPEFQHLADEIGRLGDQSAALSAFTQLAAQTGDLAAKQVDAATAVDELAKKLDTAQASTVAATAAQRAIATELDAARTAARATRDELATLSATTTAAGKAEESYATQVSELRVAKIAQRAAVEGLTASLAESNQTVKAAQTAEDALEGAYSRASGAAKSASDAVTAQQSALTQSAAAAEELGVVTGNVAASQVTLLRALNEAGQAALVAQAAVAKLARAEEELAASNAFQKQADDSKRLFDTASYAELFDQALANVAKTTREVVAAQAALDWQREAEAIVNATEATKRLAAQSQELLAIQAELANDKAMAQQAADAEKLADQAARIHLFTEALDQLEAQERAAAAAGAQAATQINAAFGEVGVKSADALRAEVVQVRAAMETLKTQAGLTGGALQSAFNSGNAKIAELEREIRSVNGQMTLGDQAAKLFSNSIGQIAAGNIIADGVGYLVNKVKELGAAFVAANVQNETMTRGLKAIYGTAQIAAEQMNFLRSTAQASGLAVGSISESFVRFSAATRTSNIPLSVTNDLFAAVTRAGSTLGLTGERVTLVLDALGQMASKGVVSMEELRQQLGDSLPGALSLAAKGLGITDQQLVKLVESGKLAAEDFFPALTKGLSNMQGTNDTLAASFGRLSTALNTVAVVSGDAGWLDVLKGGMTALKVVLFAIVVPLAAMGEALLMVGKAAGIMAAAVVTGTNPLNDLKQIASDADARMQKLTDAFSSTGTAAAAQGAQVSAAAAIQAGHTSGVLAAAVAQASSASSTDANTKTYIQQLVALQQNSSAVEAAVLASQQLVKAKEEEGKANVSAAQLTGSASKALDAQAVAATNNATVSATVVAARQREVDLSTSIITALQAEITKGNDLSGQKARTLIDSQKALLVQEAELEKSRQTTFELSRQALAATTAAAAYADNSTKLAAYKDAMDLTRQVVVSLSSTLEVQTKQFADLDYQLGVGRITHEEYTKAKEALRVTTEQLNDATGRAASAEALYRDTVADSVKALDLKARVATADLNVSLAQINASQKHYEALSKEAAAQGDTTLAMQFSIDGKLKEIEAITLSTKIKGLELLADKAGIEVRIAALDPQDKLYKAQLAELDILLEVIKAKQIANSGSADQIKGIQAEIDALRLLNETRGRGIETSKDSTSATDTDTASRLKNAAAVDTQNTALGKKTGDGLATNKDGSAAGTFTNGTPMDMAFQVLNKGTGAGDLTYLKAAQQQALNGQAWLRSMASAGGATSISQEAYSSTAQLVRATTDAVKSATAAAANAAASTAAPTANTAPPAAAFNASTAAPVSAPAAGNTTHTVNVVINGATTSVNAASAQDAAAMAAIIKQLGAASGTSTKS